MRYVSPVDPKADNILEHFLRDVIEGEIDIVHLIFNLGNHHENYFSAWFAVVLASRCVGIYILIDTEEIPVFIFSVLASDPHM